MINVARTARSTSSASASTWASGRPVAGFGVAKVLPEAASTHRPSMKSCRGVATKSSTLLSKVTVISVGFLSMNVRSPGAWLGRPSRRLVVLMRLLTA